MSGPIRVAYTVEQCWHDTPGGTAVAALEIVEELERLDEVEIHLVAGKHAAPPQSPYAPNGTVAMLPLARPWLYESWTRLNWPKVESVTGPVDVVHATGLVPAATSAPLVVTLHDLAFLHTPDKFTRHGARLMRRSLDVMRKRADRIICSSQATVDDCLQLGVPDDQLSLVPLGVGTRTATRAEVDAARRLLKLPERFVLFVGTIEPRKNLARLCRAMSRLHLDAAHGDIPLVVAGAAGWGDGWGDGSGDAHGDSVDGDRADVQFLGFVPDDQLRGLYAAATVFAYPSEREGFGLPVLEAMVQGTPVVTSRGTSTEEVAGGAAVLVDPFDVDDIARGIADAMRAASDLSSRGQARAAEMTWSAAAERTLGVYREVFR